MSTRVAASGYFDPLHAGHVEYLQMAKELGDELIVIINNDAQAMRKSGQIMMKQEDRMAVVKALGCVDEVVLSIDEDATVCKTLESIKPNIFAKGGDRTADEIPESEVCRRIGARIVDGLGEKKDHSSRIRAQTSGVVPVPPEETVTVEKIWGGEKWIANNNKYCGKFLTIHDGKHTSWHMHCIKDEVIYVHDGTLTLLFKQAGKEDHVQEVVLPAGQGVRIFPKTRHRLWAKDGDVVLIEVSTRHTEADTVREGDPQW